MNTDTKTLIDRLRNDPKRCVRYDLNGNGVIDDDEWKLVAQLAENELAYRTQRQSDDVYVLLDDDVFIKDYRVLGVLGQGGQATSYLCRDDIEERYLVLKERRLQVVTDWKVVDLFDREANTLSKLNHPKIPTYFDHFSIEDDGDLRLYVAQEFKSGDNLEEVLKKRGTFTEEQIEAFCADILPTLGYLHDRAVPIVHRDVKPSNIILADDGFNLIDFGSVQVSNKEMGGSTVTGTFGYAPLEQFMGKAVPASDIYALGATILELISGRPPFEWEIENGLIRLDRLELPESVIENLELMLQPFPDRRISWSDALKFNWRDVQKLNAGVITLSPKIGEELSTDLAVYQSKIPLKKIDLSIRDERITKDGIRYEVRLRKWVPSGYGPLIFVGILFLFLLSLIWKGLLVVASVAAVGFFMSAFQHKKSPKSRFRRAITVFSLTKKNLVADHIATELTCRAQKTSSRSKRKRDGLRLALEALSAQSASRVSAIS